MIKFGKGSNNRMVIGKISDIKGATRRGVRQGMFKVGHGLIKEASNEILNGPKTGRVYIIRNRNGSRRRHRASAPGQTHANLTGATRRSLSFQMRGSRQLEFGYGVSSAKQAPEQAEYLENGTKHMKPRPSLKNAVNTKRRDTIRDFKREIDEAIR